MERAEAYCVLLAWWLTSDEIVPFFPDVLATIYLNKMLCLFHIDAIISCNQAHYVIW
jgi:hypothetical protein